MYILSDMSDMGLSASKQYYSVIVQIVQELFHYIIIAQCSWAMKAHFSFCFVNIKVHLNNGSYLSKFCYIFKEFKGNI